MRKKTIYTKKICLFLSEEQRKKLEEYSIKTRISFSDIVRLAFDEYLQNHPLEDK